MFRIDVLIRLSNIAKNILEIATINHPTSIRAFEADRIFEKATLHSISFLKLWPLNSDDKSLMEVDTASLATIARVIKETHDVFHYLTETRISMNEFEFRSLLMRLHYSKKIREILNKFQFCESDGINRVFSMSECSAIRELKDNQVYQSLSSREQLRYLKGKEAYFEDRINKITLLEENIESGIYNLLSNSVHSYPLGLMNSTLGVSDNHLDGFNLLHISLEVCILYFASLIREYLKIRKKISVSISKDDKNYIREQINNEKIMHWIQERQAIGQNLYII